MIVRWRSLAIVVIDHAWCLLARRSSSGPGTRERTELAIRDVSRSGARLVGALRVREGELVRATLRLDDVSVQLIAQVTRIDVQRSQIAITYRDVSRDAAMLLESAIRAMLERQRAVSTITVIVLHPESDVRAALERDLSRLQRASRSCATPLEAISALAEPAHYGAIVIGASQGTDDLIEQLAANHPDLTRVLVFADQLQSLGHATSRRVHAVLRTPWRIRALARALGIDLNDSSLALLSAADLAGDG